MVPNAPIEGNALVKGVRAPRRLDLGGEALGHFLRDVSKFLHVGMVDGQPLGKFKILPLVSVEGVGITPVRS